MSISCQEPALPLTFDKENGRLMILVVSIYRRISFRRKFLRISCCERFWIAIHSWRRKERKMNKIMIVLSAFIFALSMANSARGQEQTKNQETSVVAKPMGEKSIEAAKSGASTEKSIREQNQEVFVKPHKIWRMGGEVKAVDLKTKTLLIHQETVHHDRLMKRKVDEKLGKELENIKPGDLVNVWVSGGRITELHKVS
jgi:hypothetical protein